MEYLEACKRYRDRSKYLHIGYLIAITKPGETALFHNGIVEYFGELSAVRSIVAQCKC